MLNETLAPLVAKLPPKHERYLIADGDLGTAQTIQQMVRMVDAARRDMRIRRLAGQIISSCGQKAWKCYAQSIWKWMRQNIKYIYDPANVEMVVHPWETIQARAGDCDDQVVLVASLAEAMGMRASFVTCKQSALHPEWSHVYIYIYTPLNEKIAIDTTQPEPCGWEPPAHMPKKEWPIDDLAEQNSSAASDGGATFQDPTAQDQQVDVMAEDTMVATVDSDPVGISGLGALSTGEAQLVVEKMISGEYAGELRAARTRMLNNLDYTYNLLTAAQSLPEGEAREQLLPSAQAARAAMLQAKSDLDETISQYNALANAIQTYSGNTVKPPSLGVLTTATIITITAGVTIVAGLFYSAYMRSNSSVAQATEKMNAAASLATALKSAGYSDEEARAIIDKVSEPPSETGGLLGSIGTAAIVAAVALVGFLVLKKKNVI